MSVLRALVVVGLAAVASVANAACSVTPVKVVVGAESAPVEMKKHFDYAPAKHLADITGHTYNPRSPVYGATQGNWSTSVNLEDYAVGRFPDGRPCVAVKKVEVKIALKDFEVLIGDFLKGYPCMREHVIEHEYEHVELYKRQLKESLTPVANGLYRDIERLNGFPVTSEATAGREVLLKLVEMATAQLRSYRTDVVSRAHAQIDSEITEAAHSAACGGETHIIEAALSGR